MTDLLKELRLVPIGIHVDVAKLTLHPVFNMLAFVSIEFRATPYVHYNCV